MNALQRRIRREANRLVTRRRYRANRKAKASSTTPLTMPMWVVRIGPAGPSAKALARKKAERERFQ